MKKELWEMSIFGFLRWVSLGEREQESPLSLWEFSGYLKQLREELLLMESTSLILASMTSDPESPSFLRSETVAINYSEFYLTQPHHVIILQNDDDVQKSVGM